MHDYIQHLLLPTAEEVLITMTFTYIYIKHMTFAYIFITLM